jgi:hypothetical protein
MERAAIKPARIAAELKVDPETVRLWQRGKRMAKDRNLKDLAHLIGVSPGYLQHGEAGGASGMPPALVVKDDEERLLLETFRQLPAWAKTSVQARVNELLENFGHAGPGNPFGKKKGSTAGTQ